MKALQIERAGSLDDIAIRDVSVAPLREGDVRVRIEAAGVNPSDVATVLGKFPQLTLPRVLGRDFAGQIVEGPPNLVAAPVWGSGGSELGFTRDGGHAQYLVVPAAAVARRPSQLSAEGAAAAALPFFTAWSALVGLAGIKAGQWAIVSGAAGAVGSAAVQLIDALGAHAIALIQESDDDTWLRQSSAAAIARFERNELAAISRDVTGGRGADVALNAVGAPVFSALFDALAKDGRMVVFSAAAGRDVQLDLFALYRNRLVLLGLDTASIGMDRVASALENLNPLFESKVLAEPPIGARYPLSRAREAYERVHGGFAGKVVLIPE